MRTRRVVAMTRALAGLIAVAVVGSVTFAQGPTLPKTPWGDPDLQGTFSSEAELSVPFERQAQYGEFAKGLLNFDSDGTPPRISCGQ